MDRQSLIETFPIPWDQKTIKEFRNRLLTWYDKYGRQLPWRESNNPYFIWVSEIMLQQTQVETVIPYYQRFIEELPTIQSLAMVDSESLMQLWQGLGYYSRVRNMQIAAKQIMEIHKGKMPNTYEELLSLRGIGPYTAGAIASIAFNLAEPAMDGNLIRIITRLFEIKEDITRQATKNRIMAYLYQLIDPKRPGDFNQALMDLGATIHTAQNYDISESPIKEFDQSFRNGSSHLYPVKRKKNKASQHHYLAYAIQTNDGRLLMRKHSEKELLTSLWHFPLVETHVNLNESNLSEIVSPLFEKFSEDLAMMKIKENKLVQMQDYYSDIMSGLSVKHVFSHQVWHVQIIPLSIEGNVYELNESEMKWVSKSDINEIARSTLQNKIFGKLYPEFEEIDEYI